MACRSHRGSLDRDGHTEDKAAQLTWDLDRRFQEAHAEEEEKAPELALTLGPYSDLRVLVRHEDGAPVADAVMTLHLLGDTARTVPLFFGTTANSAESFQTNREGRAAIRLLSQDLSLRSGQVAQWRLHVVQVGGEVTAHDLEPGAQEQAITLETSGLCRATIQVAGLPRNPELRRGARLRFKPKGQTEMSASGSLYTLGVPPDLGAQAKEPRRAWTLTPVQDQEALTIFQQGAPLEWRLEVPGMAPRTGHWIVPPVEGGHDKARSWPLARDLYGGDGGRGRRPLRAQLVPPLLRRQRPG